MTNIENFLSLVRRRGYEKVPVDFKLCPSLGKKFDEYVKSSGFEYKKTMAKYEGENVRIEEIERFAFYERAKTVYAVVATGEKALYANLIIKKGVI